MSRPRGIPTYRHHKQSGQALVTLTDGLGGRHDVLLGRHGTKASRQEYGRVLAEWEARGRTLAIGAAAADLTIVELVKRFRPWAEAHYRHADGTPTSEISELKQTMRPLIALYGDTLAKDFGPLALKAVREAMISGSWIGAKEEAKRAKGGHLKSTWSRGVVNKRLARIRRLIKWAVENELVPPSMLHGLQAVRGLQRGRSAARETSPVKPVPESFVRAVLPFLLAPVRAMVELQLLTGMRPGEVVIMRGCDLDMSGKVWFYRPARHKTQHRDLHRVVAIGPRGQAILRPWLRLKLEEYLFQPAEGLAQRRADLRAARKSKVQPSQAKRKRRRPKRQPGDHYTTATYGAAIARGIERANAAAKLENKPEIPHWHAHQLRHTKATQIRNEFGLDAARVALGHRSPAITEVYAELDQGKAAEVAARLG